jgi:hypothetical protein
MVLLHRLGLRILDSAVLLLLLRQLNWLDVNLDIQLVEIFLLLSRLGSLFLRAVTRCLLDIDAALATVLRAQTLSVRMVLDDALVTHNLWRLLTLQPVLEGQDFRVVWGQLNGLLDMLNG